MINSTPTLFTSCSALPPEGAARLQSGKAGPAARTWQGRTFLSPIGLSAPPFLESISVITLALSKGRIFDDILPLRRGAGIEVLDDPEKTRKLILSTNQPDVRVLLVRATDVPTYVQYGGADLGVVGKDTLLESGSQGLYQPLDLQSARCRISVAVREGFDYAGAIRQGSRLRVATKYVR